MTPRRPSATLAWALVALVVLAGYAVIAAPLLELHRERQARIDLLDEAIAGRSALIARGAALAESRDRLTARAPGAEAIIPDRDTSAVARLQEHLRLAASAEGLRVDSLRVLSDRALAPLREVAVQATLSGSVAQAQKLLHGLESGDLLVRIPNLSLLARPGTSDLEITLEIAALAEGGPHAD